MGEEMGRIVQMDTDFFDFLRISSTVHKKSVFIRPVRSPIVPQNHFSLRITLQGWMDVSAAVLSTFKTTGDKPVNNSLNLP
jgi:hypothetical protein